VKTHDRDCFFKYATAETARLILTNLSVRWSSPLLFNDPFDTQLEFNPGIEPSRVPDLLLPRIETLVYSNDPLPPRMNATLSTGIKLLRVVRDRAARSALFAGFREALEQGYTRARKELEQAQAAWTASLNKMRVFCVSEIHDDLLMWSHYGDHHRGAVLQLRCIPEKDTALCAAEAIRYRVDIPAWGTTEEWVEHMLGGSHAFLGGIFRLMAFTKSEHWQYEREWRCWIADGRGGSDLFEVNKLEEEEVFAVYLGCRMLPEDREDLCALVRERLPATQLYQARRSRTKFALEFDLVE
jgi:hypothetical protein